MRTGTQGYNVPDSNRQKYAMLERDSTGLDHTWWRKYESMAGRWTSPDPLSGSIGDPQSFNSYSYTQNDPVNFVDPNGLDDIDIIRFWIWASLMSGGGGGGGGHNTILGVSPWADAPRKPWGNPQNPGPTPTPNRNCITNAVRGATGLARPFGNVGPTGTIGHDGIHVVAPAGSRVTTLAPLVGTVLRIHDADEGKTHIVDVLLDKGGFVALYKDLVTVSVRPGQHLGVGSTIGSVGAYEGGGLHFALLNGGRAADKYYRSLTSTNQTNKIKVDMFTNPNGPNSPVNCPGVPVNNAGVNPHP